jgi:O-glycosyl hydrolase
MKKLIAVLAVLMVLTLTLITTCQMEVAETVQDIALTDPYISFQPASASYFVGETPASTLFIQVKDWIEDDGNLTYQWYTFDDINDFVKDGRGTEIAGASGALTLDAATGLSSAAYTPELKTTAGSKNYYYVVITNNNSKVNVGNKTGSIQSEVAVISFTAAGGALPPVISRHPGSADYQVGRSLSALNVRAAARSDRADALVTYQWYTKTIGEEGTTPKDDPIAGATASSYQPDSTLLKFGKNYFFVEVTSTEDPEGAARKATERSVPAVIQIVAGARAVAPSITVQPKDKMYFTGETVAPLTVAGSSRDNGDISYQWYSNTGPVITDSSGTAIVGATGTGAVSEFTPTVETSTAGTFYYYAVVTNKNESVTNKDETTASAVSKVAKVSVADSGSPAANATVTVANPKSPANRYQYVRGYGGMDVAWANFPRQYQEDMHTMYNPDTGLGYNINRIMISPGNVDPTKGIQTLLETHRPDYYENVKIVNSYGGYNLASPWSPPKEWKTNNSINGGGKLIKAYYKQFADYLRTFAQDMYDHGAPIYAISISNEPNYTAGYDGCEWDGKEMMEFYAEMGRFTNGVRGFGGGRQIATVLTVNGESANNPDINIDALTNPVSRAAIDLYCRHVYGEQTATLWRYGLDGKPLLGSMPRTSDTVNILDRGNGTKFEVWMTEHNINSANATAYPSDSTWNYVWRFMNDIDLVMRMNNENAFVWWASKRFYSMLGDGSYGTDPEGIVLPRGYGLSHYAKYSIDTHRIVATVSGSTGDGAPITFERDGANVNNNDWKNAGLDNESARITAYASITSGKDNAPINDAVGLADVEFISLIMWTPTNTNGRNGVNMGTVEIKMPDGFKIGSYTAIRSTGGGQNAHRPDTTIIVNQERTSAFVNLPASQMLSVKFIKE